MRTLRCWKCLAVGLAVAAIAGCATTGPTVDTSAQSNEGIPRITALYQRATAHRVHPFRRPVRDRRARLLRQLAIECDDLIARIGATEGAAELTAADGEQGGTAPTDAIALRSSLEDLRTAADRGDMRTLRTAHAEASAAYNRGVR